mmetsp:Transcript_28952/g.47403  ORF Transcript_28952/g.47403 Transcript_28952/m.47403 type:complete len:227 (-) Transcript_28952:29-709(-)
MPLFSSSWRNDNNATLWKQLIVVGAAIGGAVINHWYLKRKRQDLPNPQKQGFKLYGYGYALQIALKLFYIQKTRNVNWLELLVGPITFPVMFLIPSYYANPLKPKRRESTWLPIASNILYGVGMFILISSEYQRKIFKSNSENKGKLYTEGFNAWSRHPNYAAEVVLFAGWSLLSNNKHLLLYPAVMTAQFYTIVIPELEDYLGKKYNNEWKQYEKNVKSLFPFVY